MALRDRSDFIDNLKAAHTHLLVLTEDIRYPLDEQQQKFLDVATKAVGFILNQFLKEDIEAVLAAVAEQP